MAASDGYGQRLGERLRAEQAHTVITRGLRTADMAITETRCDAPVVGMSDSIQREDAYLVALSLRDFPNRQYWEDGRQMPVHSLRTWQVDFHDLKRDPVALLDKPYHDLFFYLPAGALHAIADDVNAPRVSELNYNSAPDEDATISNLARAVLPASIALTKRANYLSTIFSSRSGFTSPRHTAGCGHFHRWSEVDSRHGRRDVPRKYSAPISMVVYCSKK
jgi:AraC family transcriptional regulator